MEIIVSFLYSTLQLYKSRTLKVKECHESYLLIDFLSGLILCLSSKGR